MTINITHNVSAKEPTKQMLQLDNTIGHICIGDMEFNPITGSLKGVIVDEKANSNSNGAYVYMTVTMDTYPEDRIAITLHVAIWDAIKDMHGFEKIFTQLLKTGKDLTL